VWKFARVLELSACQFTDFAVPPVVQYYSLVTAFKISSTGIQILAYYAIPTCRTLGTSTCKAKIFRNGFRKAIINGVKRKE
jgi:hypothetical protein